MLWPLFVSDGLQSDDGTDLGRGTYGFVDAAGHKVVPANYERFTYCVAGKRPTRLVAAREGTIDVFALDGSVTRTIKTADASRGTLLCVGNKTIALVESDETTAITWQEAFDLSTGAKVSAPMTKKRYEGCIGVGAETDPQEPTLPDGYPIDAYGGWATNEDWTMFINIETRATVENPSGTCQGSDGFLNCSGGQFAQVYDKHGNLTEFANVTSRYVLTSMCDSEVKGLVDDPYLWAIVGQVQGYIDRAGVWYFQEPLHTALND